MKAVILAGGYGTRLEEETVVSVNAANVVEPADNVSNAGGLPAPVLVNTCPSEPVATATGFPEAS